MQRPSLVATVSTAAILAAWINTANAQGLNLTDAEKTPAKCDITYKVTDLAGLKAPKAKKPYKIEFSVPMFIPYLQAVIYGAQQAAKEAGVTLTTDAGKGFMDPASQITQVENALTHKPDALLINPSDPEGMAPTIDETIANGTPVFDVGTLSASTNPLRSFRMITRKASSPQKPFPNSFPRADKASSWQGRRNASWARRRVAGFLEGIKTRTQYQT